MAIHLKYLFGEIRIVLLTSIWPRSSTWSMLSYTLLATSFLSDRLMGKLDKIQCKAYQSILWWNPSNIIIKHTWILHINELVKRAIGYIFYHLNNQRLWLSSFLILTIHVSWYSTLWWTASNKRTLSQSLVKKNLISTAETELSQLWNHDYWAQPSVFMGLAEVESPQSASQ